MAQAVTRLSTAQDKIGMVAGACSCCNRKTYRTTLEACSSCEVQRRKCSASKSFKVPGLGNDRSEWCFHDFMSG